MFIIRIQFKYAKIHRHLNTFKSMVPTASSTQGNTYGPISVRK